MHICKSCCPIPGARIDIKMSYQHRNSHYKDETVSRPSYLYNGNPIPEKTVFTLRKGRGANSFNCYTKCAMAVITIPIPDTKDLFYRGCIFYDAPPMITILQYNLCYMRSYHLVFTTMFYTAWGVFFDSPKKDTTRTRPDTPWVK